MRFRSNVQVLFAAVVLIGSLALYGCPKRPEVLQAGPAAVGPQAATSPAPAAPAQPAPRTAETPVTRTPAPAETPVQPSPAAAAPAAAAAVPGPSPLKDVFFDFDKSNIRDHQKAALNDNVGWLKGNAGA